MDLMVLVGQFGNVVFGPKWMYHKPEDFIQMVVIPFMDGADANDEPSDDDGVVMANFDPDADDSDFSLSLSADGLIDEARIIMLLRVLETRYLCPDEDTGQLTWGDDPSEGTAVWVVDFDKVEQAWEELNMGDLDGPVDDEEDD